jgi:Alginate lyase
MRKARIGSLFAAFALAAMPAFGCVGDVDNVPVDEVATDPELFSQLHEPEADTEADSEADPGLFPTSEAALVAPAQFKHPGVLVNRAQLDFVRGKVHDGAQPWKGVYDKMLASEYGKLNWQPKARETVNCGSRSNPNEGCSDERRDAVAAYTHALLWYMGGDRRHADKAIAILDAWARTIKRHTGHNAPLQTGWSACMFPAAAEIIRYSYDGWSQQSVQRVIDVFKNVYLPTVQNGNAGANGNWELIMTEATINLAVFLDDRNAFDKAVSLWRRRVPAYIYMTSDGEYPKAATSKHNTRAKIIKYWQGQSTFVNGLAQETCRDFGHTQWGISAAIGAAETAYQQGIDLYGEQSARLRAGLEFHSEYIMGKPAPSWLCNGEISLSSIPTGEIAFNHFKNRKGDSMRFTEQYLKDKVRPKPDLTNYFIAWEQLTHFGTGNTGL